MSTFSDILSTTNTSTSISRSITKEDIAVLSVDNLITSDKYDWYNNYQDDSYSSVGTDKSIIVDDSQINLTQEENSQYIPFKMPRYWDGIDLMDMSIRIRFVNKNKEEGIALPVNVQYNDTTIIFHWLIDAYTTNVSGELTFEIFATGANEKGENYVWRTKPNGKLNILESLVGDGAIEMDSDWTMSFIREMDAKIGEAQVAANEAAGAAAQAKDTADQLANKINSFESDIEATVAESVASELTNYYTKPEVNKLFDDFDISDQLQDVQNQIDNMDGLADFNVEYESTGQILKFYNGEEVMNEIALDMTPKPEWVSAYNIAVESKITDTTTQLSKEFDEKLQNVDVTAALEELEDKISNSYYNKEETDLKYAEKTSMTAVTNELSKLSSSVESNTTNVKSLSEKMLEIEETLNSVNTDPSKRYYSTYDASTGEYKLIEAVDDGEGGETETVVSQHIIQGGSGGGGGSSSTVTIDRITQSPAVALKDDESIEIKYNFTSVDSSGDDTGEGTAVWKVGNSVVATTMVLQGENTFDIKPYVSTGTYKVTLTITDAVGSVSMKNWTVQVIDVKLESTFNDSYVYPMGEVSFAYTPYGSIAKTVHFKLDGKELGTVNTSVSGVPMNYTIPGQEHGAHLLEAYITAEINNSTIETTHIYKDIMWCDPSSDVPIIGTIYQNFTAKQYDTTNIVYTVYDPKTETPSVVLTVDEKTVSTLTMESSTNTWAYKSNDEGEHTLTITCRDTVKIINANIEKLDIDVTPVTANIAFDFNPIGYSNSDTENRLWKDGSITMAVSDNFDWVNGGYQIDENGDQYFCVKSGTTATINYNLFSDDPKRNGKEFKVVFCTDNVRNRNTSFITCMDSGIGLDMMVESAYIYSSNDSLYAPYCENDIIEFEFNINKDTDIPMVLTYEDGVPSRPMIYTSDSVFKQSTAQPIIIGSEDCDVHVYRMKAYTANLANADVKNNFIADARNAEEMVSRYKRNQIYDENGSLTPETLAEKCPDLRIVVVDCPWFTNDKSDKVSDTTIKMIYKNGDPVLDNWTCTGAKVSGQGTSSNEYGYSGRNMDLIMDGDDALFTLGDGVTTSKTVTLTRNSVPTDYYNVKVNIASSENENNAQMTNRYNDYNPFKRTAKLKDSKVRDTMEFYNCVVFVRENNEDLSTHREFNDTDYHFYAIGNIGDSKKTDDTRVNDNTDPKEHVIEIMDYNVALAEFPTGYTDKEGKKAICPESEWKEGNTAYDYLYADYKYKNGEFKSFGSESYEFRYEKKDITTEEREANINAWREAYKFVVTSDDEDFVENFEKYFVKDSILYYYLFTERYLATDNRAKNTFIHYGKVWYSESEAVQFKTDNGVEIESKYVDDTQAAFNNGYRYDLSFGYDFDRVLSK